MDDTLPSMGNQDDWSSLDDPGTDVRIAGTGSYLPGKPLTIDQVDKVLGELTEAPQKIQDWMKRMKLLMKELLEVEHYHYAIDPGTREFTDDNITMSVKAAQKALAEAEKVGLLGNNILDSGFDLQLEVFQAADPRHGYQEVAPHIAHTALHAPFFVGLPWGAEAALEEVVAAQTDERLLLLAIASLQDPFHGCFQIVVADPLRNTAQIVKGGHMRREERFLTLCREGHGKDLTRVAQAQDKQLDFGPDAGHLYPTFPPVCLPILAWLILQRDEDLGPLHAPPP